MITKNTIMTHLKKLTLAALMATLLFACKNNEAQLDSEISLSVSVMEVEPSGIQKFIQVNGNVAPLKKAQLKTEVSGKYQLQINPKKGREYALGDYVEAGSVIVKLVDKEFENGIKMESLELNLEVSEQTHDKQKSLYDKGGATLSELKRAEVEYINAKYNYEDANLRLEKLNIRAPFSGIIVELPYNTTGVKVDAGLMIASMMDYSNLIMEVDFPEKDLTTLQSGQEVLVTNYTFPEDTLMAKITQLSPAIDPESRSFKGVITVKNPDLLLRPGMFVSANVVVTSIDSTIVLPKDMILSKERGNTVFVIVKGIAQERIVKFGLENPTEVQILSGLTIGERVVIKGYETLRSQAKVKVVK